MTFCFNLHSKIWLISKVIFVELFSRVWNASKCPLFLTTKAELNTLLVRINNPSRCFCRKCLVRNFTVYLSHIHQLCCKFCTQNPENRFLSLYLIKTNMIGIHAHINSRFIPNQWTSHSKTPIYCLVFFECAKNSQRVNPSSTLT